MRCVFASQKSEASPPREPHQAAAQKFDRSRFFRITILPRKSHIRQKEPYALGAAVEWVLVTRCSCVSRVGCRMASGIVSDLSWCQKLQEQKCEKLSAVIRSKLFLHEYENNTHETEQALPAWRVSGRSSRRTRPLLSSSDGARSRRVRLRCLLLYC